MPIKYYKPTTPGLRKASVVSSHELSGEEPEKSLIKILKKKAGRSQGKITVRHKGGGAKRYYRLIDFRRDKFNIEARVIFLEYDPNRSAWIALVRYEDGEKRYIIAPQGLKVDDVIISSQERAPFKIGNAMPLENIPTGLIVHNIELTPHGGAKIVRSAGLGATMMGVEGKYAQLKLPSGEIRLILKRCLATIGQISNPEYRAIRLGKAGRKRHMGIRPTVRGKAMNPVDHPHGGGEGVQPIGLKHPKTQWGKPAFGVRTRRKKKWSRRLIIKRRR